MVKRQPEVGKHVEKHAKKDVEKDAETDAGKDYDRGGAVAASSCARVNHWHSCSAASVGVAP